VNLTQDYNQDKIMNCQECQNLVDEYFHHELSFKIKKRVRGHLKGCSACETEYLQYEKMLQEIDSLGIQPCPEEVTEQVFQILNLADETTKHFSFIEKIINFLNRYRWKFALAGATVVIVFFMILIYPKINRPTNIKQQYTEAEIEQATDQVKLALAYFNEITSRTQKIIEEQVLPHQVIEPMKSSIKTAIKPLLNGGES
jgi:hypothetical protein